MADVGPARLIELSLVPGLAALMMPSLPPESLGLLPCTQRTGERAVCQVMVHTETQRRGDHESEQDDETQNEAVIRPVMTRALE